MIVLMGALLGTTFTTLEKKRLKLLVGMKSCASGVKTALVRRGHTLDRALLDAKCSDTRLFKRCGEIFAEHPLYDAKTAAQIAAGATREEGVDAGILIAVLSQLLSRAGRDDIALMTSIAGLVIVLLMVVDLVSSLFDSVKSIFGLY